MTALRVPRRLCWLVLDERSCTRLGARAARGLPEIPSCTRYAPQPLGHLGLSGTWISTPSTRTTSGLSLHEAASMGHPDCVRYLLARGPPSTAWKADC
ncbi:ankyrin repeat domain-containing protein 16-like isoform X2 [Bos indicus x Bos taurus]|nr:ankyrin repeat domain-containing protein 16-like isoform X2 [Bos indicus x Bos taurus]